jgi:hypothetical protein
MSKEYMDQLREKYGREEEAKRHAREVESRRSPEWHELYGDNSAQWVKRREYKGGSQGSY